MSTGAAGRLVVRAPNHLGEVLLSIPALSRAIELERSRGAPEPVIQVVEWLEPIVKMAGLEAEVVGLLDRHAVWGAAQRLRGLDCDRGVLLTPAFSAALIFSLAGLTERRGTDGGGRGFLLTDPVDRGPLLQAHRVDEFLSLVDPGYESAAEPPHPGLRALDPARVAWNEFRERLSIQDSSAPVVALIPSAQARSRRWPARRFGELAGRLAADGCRVLIFGGPTDTAVTAEVAEYVPAGADVWDLGGRTSLEEVTGGLAECDLVVTNDSGPMHLAAALDRPIVALEGPADVRQTRPLADRVRLVGRFDLPCVPCVKNTCPREGAGYVLPEARRECMWLIDLEDVYEVARANL